MKKLHTWADRAVTWVSIMMAQGVVFSCWQHGLLNPVHVVADLGVDPQACPSGHSHSPRTQCPELSWAVSHRAARVTLGDGGVTDKLFINREEKGMGATHSLNFTRPLFPLALGPTNLPHCQERPQPNLLISPGTDHQPTAPRPIHILPPGGHVWAGVSPGRNPCLPPGSQHRSCC